MSTIFLTTYLTSLVIMLNFGQSMSTFLTKRGSAAKPREMKEAFNDGRSFYEDKS
jgi:hypothetical protein